MHAVRHLGHAYELLGVHLSPGDDAHRFSLLGVDAQSEIEAPARTGPSVILSVPSLDTPVCDEEAKTFIKRASEMPGVSVFVVSMDLPYAMERWISYNPTDALILGSDHRRGTFATAYGVLIDELRILTRAAFVVDGLGIVTYAEYMPELNKQVDFDAIVKAAKEAK